MGPYLQALLNMQKASQVQSEQPLPGLVMFPGKSMGQGLPGPLPLPGLQPPQGMDQGLPGPWAPPLDPTAAPAQPTGILALPAPLGQQQAARSCLARGLALASMWMPCRQSWQRGSMQQLMVKMGPLLWMHMQRPLSQGAATTGQDTTQGAATRQDSSPEAHQEGFFEKACSSTHGKFLCEFGFPRHQQQGTLGVWQLQSVLWQDTVQAYAADG